MTRRDMDQYFADLEVEFNEQRASTIARFGRRLEEEFIACTERLDKLDTDKSDQQVLLNYREARAAFLEARSAFILQREMLGLLEHHRVDEIFPTPPQR